MNNNNCMYCNKKLREKFITIRMTDKIARLHVICKLSFLHKEVNERVEKVIDKFIENMNDEDYDNDTKVEMIKEHVKNHKFEPIFRWVNNPSKGDVNRPIYWNHFGEKTLVFNDILAKYCGDKYNSTDMLYNKIKEFCE